MRLQNGIYSSENGNILMISTTGNLKEVRPELADTKKAEGWRYVSNPRRSWYPEFDMSMGGVSAPENLRDNLEESDILPGGWI